jgi:hypothetical protein
VREAGVSTTAIAYARYGNIHTCIESPLRGTGVFIISQVELLNAPSCKAKPPEKARLQHAIMNV